MDALIKTIITVAILATFSIGAALGCAYSAAGIATFVAYQMAGLITRQMSHFKTFQAV